MPNNRTEINGLAVELREYLHYLQELGVSELSADLSEFDFAESQQELNQSSTHRKPKSPPSRIAPAQINDFIGQMRGGIKSDAADDQSKKNPRDLLAGTKLSDMTKQNETNSPIAKPAENKPKKASGSPIESEQANEQIAESAFGNESLKDIRTDIGADCARCELCEKRTQVVNSVGSASADLMIIGEAPGADEDLKGEPFVGRAGKLLTKILEAIDFQREDVFIGNINRCRPPGNRQPTLEESAMCKPFLLREIAAVKPKVIVVLGNTATKNLLDTKTGITKLRGTFVEKFGVKVMPTFHPAYLLRDPRKKREVWDDMKKVKSYLESGSI